MSEKTLLPMEYRPRCRYCDKPLPAYQYHRAGYSKTPYGYRGDGLFCSLRCGYRYGLTLARTLKTEGE